MTCFIDFEEVLARLFIQSFVCLFVGKEVTMNRLDPKLPIGICVTIRLNRWYKSNHQWCLVASRKLVIH